MKAIEDLTLIKLLGKGSFGEVYLSTKKGTNKNFATKQIPRKIMDKPSLKKYFDNEIEILKRLKHPNIVQLEEIKTTANNYYIVMEYINGGGLSDCLKKYMEKNGKPFSEEIVQHLMKQIIDALYYIHSLKIIHRDLKLDNIMINFETIYDKEKLNMMKATIKIIDFGFAIQLDKQDITFSAVGSPINMDPIILNKFSKRKDINLGYDTKADIWSIGTVCYELLVGKAAFGGKSIADLADKLDIGNYSIPSSLSKETVTFLTGMLLYNAKDRLSAEQLLKQKFLTKDIKYFNYGKNKDKSNNEVKTDKSKDIVNLKDKPIAEEELPKKIPLEKTKTHRRNSEQYTNDIHNKLLNMNNFNNNGKKSNNNEQDLVRKVQTHKQSPLGFHLKSNQNTYQSVPQNVLPQMGLPGLPGLPQMNMQQNPMMGYSPYGMPYPYNYNNYYPYYSSPNIVPQK